MGWTLSPSDPAFIGGKGRAPAEVHEGLHNAQTPRRIQTERIRPLIGPLIGPLISPLINSPIQPQNLENIEMGRF